MINISNGGVGIEYPVATELGTKLKILFSVPTEIDAFPIKADVEVCHVHFKNNAFQIGLQFINLPIPDKLIISSFIQKKLAQKKKPNKLIT